MPGSYGGPAVWRGAGKSWHAAGAALADEHAHIVPAGGCGGTDAGAGAAAGGGTIGSRFCFGGGGLAAGSGGIGSKR